MDVLKILNNAGNALNRVIQQAEEKIFFAERTEYEEEYVCSVRKLNALISITESLIEETEVMLEPNPGVLFLNKMYGCGSSGCHIAECLFSGSALRMEGKLLERVDIKSDRITPLEDLGIAFDCASHEVKEYNYELYEDFSDCGKYESNLGVASKEFQKSANEIYVWKLKTMLDEDLSRFKKEEETLENLRLDYDSLRIRIKKAITVAGKAALEKDFEVVKNDFEVKLESNYKFFKDIDQYFDVHRNLLKDFIETQTKFYANCHNDLEKLKSKIELRISSLNNVWMSDEYEDRDRSEVQSDSLQDERTKGISTNISSNFMKQKETVDDCDNLVDRKMQSKTSLIVAPLNYQEGLPENERNVKEKVLVSNEQEKMVEINNVTKEEKRDEDKGIEISLNDKFDKGKSIGTLEESHVPYEGFERPLTGGDINIEKHLFQKNSEEGIKTKDKKNEMEEFPVINSTIGDNIYQITSLKTNVQNERAESQKSGENQTETFGKVEGSLNEEGPESGKNSPDRRKMEYESKIIDGDNKAVILDAGNLGCNKDLEKEDEKKEKSLDVDVSK